MVTILDGNPEHVTCEGEKNICNHSKVNASKRLNVPKILLLIKWTGESIDRSTCVSAARLNIPIGLYFVKIFMSLFLLLIFFRPKCSYKNFWANPTRKQVI